MLVSCICMTKVQVRFRLLKPLDETLLARISDAHALYGMQRIQVAPSLNALTVEYTPPASDPRKWRPPSPAQASR